MPCLHPQYIKTEVLGKPYWHVVPCGKCVNCLASRRNSWTFRLIMEKLQSKSSYFVTLTYDDDHIIECIDDDCDWPSVNKEHCQRFIKRFRKEMPFRYFLVSEYGDKHKRCHYHALLFFPEELEFSDCVHLVSKHWPYGNIMVGDVTPASIAYCSKYSLKDKNYQVVDKDTGYVFKCHPPFAIMSRRPGIGFNFVNDKFFRELVADGQFMFVYDGKKYLIPRYYREKLFDLPLKTKYYEFIAENLKKEYKNQKFGLDFLEQERRKHFKNNSR